MFLRSFNKEGTAAELYSKFKLVILSKASAVEFKEGYFLFSEILQLYSQFFCLIEVG